MKATILLLLLGVAVSWAFYIPESRYGGQLPPIWEQYQDRGSEDQEESGIRYADRIQVNREPWQHVYRVRRATPDNVRLDASVLDRTITLSGKGTVWSEGDRSLDVRGTAVQPLGGRATMDARAVLNGPEGAPTGTLSVTRTEGGDAMLRAQGSGTVWNSGDAHLDVSGGLSKTESRPATFRGQASFANDGSKVTVGAERGRDGTAVAAEGRHTLWSGDGGNAKLDATAGWQRTYGGPLGTGPVDGNVGLIFRYGTFGHACTPFDIQFNPEKCK